MIKTSTKPLNMEQGKKIMVRLILPGGGVRAVFQAGFLKEMQDSGMFEIDMAYGCSAGALICPLAVTGKVHILEDMFDTMNSIDDIVEQWSFIPNIPGLKKNWFPSLYNSLQKLLGPNNYLSKLLSFIHLYFSLGMYKRITLVDTIYNSLNKEERRVAEKKCNIVAWDLLESKNVWFKGKDLYTAMQASSALYFVVPPVRYKKSYLIDGGLNDIYAVSDIDTNFKGIYLLVDLDVREIKKYEKYPSNALSYAEILFHANPPSDTHLNTLKEKLKSRLIIVRPPRSIFDHAFDLSKDKIHEAYSDGRIRFHDFLLENLSILSKNYTKITKKD